MRTFASQGALAALFFCAACGTPDTITDADRMAASGAGQAVVSLQTALVVADALVAFDPTLDGGRDATMNAMSVETQAHTALGTCGMIVRTGTTIDVTFGPAPGCTLPSGQHVSGTVSVTLSILGGARASLVFTDVVVDGKSLAGTVTLTTNMDAATHLTASVSLMTAGGAVVGTGDVMASATGFTLGGSVTQTTTSGAATTYLLTGVHMTPGGCYPDAGTISVTTGMRTTTVEFDASTPATGTAAVTVGMLMTTTTLPAYGTCPHP